MPYVKYDGSAAAETPSATASQYGTSAGTETLTGTAGPDALWAEGPNDLLIGNGGGDTFYLQSSGTTINEVAGGAPNEIVAWQSVNLDRFNGIQNLSVGGDKTYATGNSGDNIIYATGTNQQIYGGGGEDVLVGNGQNDTFIVSKGVGNNAIYNFNISSDVLRLEGSGYTTWAQVQSHVTQVGSDVNIDLGGTDAVTLRGVTATQLTAANFQLSLDTTKLAALTFADEFNGSSLSLWDATYNPTGIWRPDYGSGGPQGESSYTLTANGEQEIYVSPYYRGAPGNYPITPFSESGGALTITAQASPAGATDLWGQPYTSGLITTKESFAQTYGYFEMRAALPHAAGGWPAFWLLPADGSWPPELDVMETLTKDANGDYTTAHSNATGTHTMSQGMAFVPDTSDGFHTYGVLWTPTELEWFVDGTEVFKTATPADMNKPMYLLANLAMGGWGGSVDDSQVPAQLKIDYIHAYALADGSSTVAYDNAHTGGGTAPPLVSPPSAGTPLTSSTASTSTGSLNLSVSSGAMTPTATTSSGEVLNSPGTYAVLTGGAGDDTIYASQGCDTLTGGAGADRFVFTTEPWAPDHITDFQVGTDKLDLSALFQAYGYKGSDPVADGWIYLADDGAGGTIVRFDHDGPGPNPLWPNTIIDLEHVSPVGLTWAQVAATVTSPAPAPAAPSALADAGVINGYVNQAHNIAGQALTGSAPIAAMVTVYDGATKLGAATADAATGQWSFTLGRLNDGAHALTAIATTPAGDSPPSAALTFTVDTQAPAAPSGLSDLAVAAGYVNAAHQNASVLSGAAEPGSTVNIYDNGASLGPATADASGAWTFNVSTLMDGQHSLTATATDAAGNVGTISSSLSFTVDTHAPLAPAGLSDVAILKGYVNAAHQSGSALSGTAEAGAVVSVYDTGALLGTTNADASGAWTYNVSALNDGQHSLTATATDNAGNVGPSSSALSFKIDTQAPSPAITDVFNSSSGQTVMGSSEAGSTVKIYDNGTLLSTVTASSTGAWSTTAKLSVGTHAFTETATDVAGNVGQSKGTALFSKLTAVALTGGAGNDVLIGSGGDTLSGGTGHDEFVFNSKFGIETVADFNPAEDVIGFDHTVFSSFSNVMQHARQSGSSVVITYDGADVITLKNTALSTLASADFVFV